MIIGCRINCRYKSVKCSINKQIFSCTNYIIKTQKDEILFEVPELIDYNRLLRSNIIGTSTAVYDTALIGKVFMPALPLAEDFANLVKHCEAV